MLDTWITGSKRQGIERSECHPVRHRAAMDAVIATVKGSLEARGD